MRRKKGKKFFMPLRREEKVMMREGEREGERRERSS